MKLLLHICCAPCGIYVVSQCRGGPCGRPSPNQVNQVTGFYFNPNIHPTEEYNKRRVALETHSNNEGIEVIYPTYQPDAFFKKVINNEERPRRCHICWRMRLEETALFAKQKGFDAFSTTLLISPYQEHLEIKRLGEELAKEVGVDFYYRDFREGFRESQNEARERNLYRQKYCGCEYSLLEAQISTDAVLSEAKDKRIHR